MQATHDLSILPPKVAARIRIEGDCWIWTGATLRSGHGTTGKNTYTHRLVYEHVNGEIPDGLIVHHECQNPPCVRPDHLRAITRKQHTAEHGLVGAAKIHAGKDLCKKGHPFDYHNGTQRVCLICRRKTAREWAKRKRALMAQENSR